VDFLWLDRDSVATELKSTSTNVVSIRRTISSHVKVAALRGVVKDVFVVDIGTAPIQPDLVAGLKVYNIENPTARIRELWLLGEARLRRIPLKD
jgi:hypothetical protein